jgi:hypothetical protein
MKKKVTRDLVVASVISGLGRIRISPFYKSLLVDLKLNCLSIEANSNLVRLSLKEG